MDNIKILHCRRTPYAHDYIIDKLVLWMFPYTIRPNHITIFRLFATPVVLFFVVKEIWSIGIPLFILVAFTDAIDGSMARIRKQITPWGTLFDPLADKVLIGGVLFILILKYINIYLGTAIILLELIVIVGALSKRRSGLVVSACVWGKIKMITQVIGVSILMLGLLTGSPTISYVAEWIFVFAIIFSVLNILNRGMVY